MDSKLHPDLSSLGRIPWATLRHWNLYIFRFILFVGQIAKFKSYPSVKIEEFKDGDAHVRVLKPTKSKPKGVLLWVHGGGYIIGKAWQDDAYCATLVKELDIMVVSTYYRLAPKHPFPAALNDCYASWSWLLSNSTKLGIQNLPIVIGGESAGGGLAASLVQRLHDENGIKPAGQLLIYPMLDDRTAACRDLDKPKHMIWNNKSNYFGWSSYLNQLPGSNDIPLYSVPSRYDNVKGMTKTWIGVGLLDLFLAENRTYAKKLKAADVECELLEVPGAVHGFASFLPDAPVSRKFINSQKDFLSKIFTT